MLYLTFRPFFVKSIELLDHLDMRLAEDTIMYYSFNTMLLMLLVFHMYWWYLICAMIVRLLKNRGKVGEDIRSGKTLIYFFVLNSVLNQLFIFLSLYESFSIIKLAKPQTIQMFFLVIYYIIREIALYIQNFFAN